MGVAVVGQHLVADQILEEGQAAPGGDIVGIDERAQAEGRFDRPSLADDAGADPRDQRVNVRRRQRRAAVWYFA